VPIRPYLEGHTVRTAAQEGWDKLRNGDLLTAAEEAGFDLSLTTDKDIRYQQNLAGRKSRLWFPAVSPRWTSLTSSVSELKWMLGVPG